MTCQRHVNFLNFERVHGRINGVAKKAAKVKAIHGCCLVVRETESRSATALSDRLQKWRKLSNAGYNRDAVCTLISRCYNHGLASHYRASTTYFLFFKEHPIHL